MMLYCIMFNFLKEEKKQVGLASTKKGLIDWMFVAAFPEIGLLQRVTNFY